MFQKGDRVKCIKKYMHGARPGDTGIIVSVEYDFLKVRWDTFSTNRHSCDGLCEPGHGWNVPMNYVALETLDVDFGELPVLDIASLL